MTRLDANFIPNLNDGISSERAVFRGNNYRITVLSERLLRLEYNPNGHFSDNLTTLVANRNFSVPAFKVDSRICTYENNLLGQKFPLLYESDGNVNIKRITI